MVFSTKDFSEIAWHQLLVSSILKLKLSRALILIPKLLYTYSFTGVWEPWGHWRLLQPQNWKLSHLSYCVSSVVPLSLLSHRTTQKTSPPWGCWRWGWGETSCDLWNTLDSTCLLTFTYKLFTVLLISSECLLTGLLWFSEVRIYIYLYIFKYTVSQA